MNKKKEPEKSIKEYFCDKHNLQDMIERGKQITPRTFGINTPTEPIQYLIEADFCYINGLYNGAIMLSWMALEFTMKEQTGFSGNAWKLIEKCREKGILDDREAEMAHQIREIRNSCIHVNLNELLDLGLIDTDRKRIPIMAPMEEQELKKKSLNALQGVGKIMEGIYGS